jgi:hypothetical protein
MRCACSVWFETSATCCVDTGKEDWTRVRATKSSYRHAVLRRQMRESDNARYDAAMSALGHQLPRHLAGGVAALPLKAVTTRSIARDAAWQVH